MTRERGFTIIELMISMVVAGIIGVALTRLVINNARFIATQDAMMKARSGARAALNVATDELRMVTAGNTVWQPSRDSFTVFVPYAYGVVCGQSGGATHIALLPTDSATYAGATPTGYAWDTTGAGTYRMVQMTGVAAGSSTLCSSAAPPVTVLTATGWSATVVAVAPNVVSTQAGSVAYLFRSIRYSFATGGQIAGRRGLWREIVGTPEREELVTPFDTSAHFEYLVGDALVPTVAPTNTDSVRAARLVLVGASEDTPIGKAAPLTFNLTTDVYFRNRGN